MINNQQIQQRSSHETGSEVIRIRLMTDDILKNLEDYLRGKKIIKVYNEKENVDEFFEQTLSIPKLNTRGVSEIMSWMRLSLNSQSVQGNFFVDKYGRSKMYDRFIYEFHGNLNNSLLLNFYKWGINVADYDNIISQIMTIIQPFFTRLIDNKERESYAESIRSSESNTINDGQRNSLISKLMAN
jgi:hypothetical protein